MFVEGQHGSTLRVRVAECQTLTVSAIVTIPGCPDLNPAITIAACCCPEVSLTVLDADGDVVDPAQCVAPGTYTVRAEGDDLDDESTDLSWSISGQAVAGNGTERDVRVAAPVSACCSDGVPVTTVSLTVTTPGCDPQTVAVSLRPCAEFVFNTCCQIFGTLVLLLFGLTVVAAALALCPQVLIVPPAVAFFVAFGLLIFLALTVPADHRGAGLVRDLSAELVPGHPAEALAGRADRRHHLHLFRQLPAVPRDADRQPAALGRRAAAPRRGPAAPVDPDLPSDAMRDGLASRRARRRQHRHRGARDDPGRGVHAAHRRDLPVARHAVPRCPRVPAAAVLRLQPDRAGGFRAVPPVALRSSRSRALRILAGGVRSRAARRGRRAVLPGRAGAQRRSIGATAAAAEPDRPHDEAAARPFACPAARADSLPRAGWT